MQTWLLLYAPDLGSNTFLSLSQGPSTLLPLSLPPPCSLPSHPPFTPGLCFFFISGAFPFLHTGSDDLSTLAVTEIFL